MNERRPGAGQRLENHMPQLLNKSRFMQLRSERTITSAGLTDPTHPNQELRRPAGH